MFGGKTEDSESKEGDETHSKYLQLQSDYSRFRAKARNPYDYYNIVEKAVLEMEGEESNRISEGQL